MKGWLDKYADGGEIRNPKTGEVIPLTGEGRPMLSSDDRNVFQRVGDRIYNEYEEHKPQLFKDFPITDLPGAVVSYITGHSDPEAGLSMVVPAGKVTPITRTVSRGRTSSSLSPFLTNEKGELRFLTAEEWQNAIRQGVKNVRGYLQDPRYKEVVERNQALAKRVKIEQSPLPIERKHNLPLYESRVAQSSESLGINDPRKLELENIQGKTKEVSQYTRDLGGSGSLTIPRIFPANATIKNTEHEMLHHVYPNLGEGYPSFTELENLKLLKTFKSPTELRQIEEATGITPWYLDDADELLPNSFDLATEIGINKFQAYPGKNSFKQMLDNYAGGKTFMRDALKLNTNRDYKRAWDLLTGVRLSAIPASIAIGSQIGDNETKNFQDGGKIENRFDIARRDVTNISPLEPPAISETYNIPDYDRDAYFSLSAADKRNALREKLSGIAFYDPFVSTVNPRDKSRVITFGEDKPELKYLRNAKFTQKAKEDVAKFAAKRNIDPNVLLSSMAIESPVLNASKYFNTHNLGMKMLERAGFPTKFKLSKDSMELPLEDLAMNAGAYMEDKSINYKKLDEKIEKWLPIANSIDSTLRTIESPMDAHALFLSEFGIDSVNPKQQVLPGVKESYSTMVKRGADYIRSRKIFEDGGNIQDEKSVRILPSQESLGVTFPPELTPEEAWNEYRNSPKWYAKASGRMQMTDSPIDMMLMGWAGGKGIEAGVNFLGKKVVPNLYKLNPWKFKPKTDMMYRGLGKEGMEDAISSGVFRPKQYPNKVTTPLRTDEGIHLRQKTFDKTYFTNKDHFNVLKNYNPSYIAEVPKDAAKFRPRYRQENDWSWLTEEQIPINRGKIYKKDWWKGYKEVPKKEDGGNVQMKNQLVNLDQLTDFSNNNKKMQTGGVVENEREEYLKQQYQNYLRSQAEKGRKAVVEGREKFAKDYLIPAIKTVGSFTPAGPIIGLMEAKQAWDEGSRGWAIAGAGLEALPYVGKGVGKAAPIVKTASRNLKKDNLKTLIYNNISPASYTGKKEEIKNLVRDIIYIDNPTIHDNPIRKNIVANPFFSGLDPNAANRNRNDAWRLYLGIGDKGEDLYKYNSRKNIYSYNPDRISEKSIYTYLNQNFNNAYDYLTSNAGGVGSINIIPSNYPDVNFAKMRDVWDLQPFKDADRSLFLDLPVINKLMFNRSGGQYKKWVPNKLKNLEIGEFLGIGKPFTVEHSIPYTSSLEKTYNPEKWMERFNANDGPLFQFNPVRKRVTDRIVYEKPDYSELRNANFTKTFQKGGIIPNIQKPNKLSNFTSSWLDKYE